MQPDSKTAGSHPCLLWFDRGVKNSIHKDQYGILRLIRNALGLDPNCVNLLADPGYLDGNTDSTGQENGCKAWFQYSDPSHSLPHLPSCQSKMRQSNKCKHHKHYLWKEFSTEHRAGLYSTASWAIFKQHHVFKYDLNAALGKI